MLPPFLILLLAAGALFATGRQEAEVRELTFLTPDNMTFAPGTPVQAGSIKTFNEWVIATFERTHPGVKVRSLTADITGGATVSIDALVAAGKPPDVYRDYTGRVSKYLDAAYAADLGPALKAAGRRYLPGVLEPLSRAGAVLALPWNYDVQGMALNMELLNAAGFAAPDKDWKVADFLRLCQRVKALGVGAYGTGLFAANQSGDYLYMNWFASFGASIYPGGGDYSRTVVDSEAGLSTLEFFSRLHTEGYVPAESATLNDDDYAAAWAAGKYAATGWFYGWTAAYQKTAREQGITDHDFPVKFVAFPSGEGVGKVPAAISYHSVVVARSHPAREALAAELALLMGGPEAMGAHAFQSGTIPNQIGVATGRTDENILRLQRILTENGPFDLGISTNTFSAVRAQFYPELQALLTGAKSPAAALSSYAANVNRILSGK